MGVRTENDVVARLTRVENSIANMSKILNDLTNEVRLALAKINPDPHDQIGKGKPPNPRA